MKLLLLFFALWALPASTAFSHEMPTSPYFGAIKLQSYDRPDLYIMQQNLRAYLQPFPSQNISVDGQWLLVPGLADLSLVSLESVNFRGYYLAQDGDRFVLRLDDRNSDSRRRATFRRSKQNSFTGTVTFESMVSPGQFLFRSNETSELLLRSLVTIEDLKAASFIELLPQGGQPSTSPLPLVKTIFESMWFPGHVLRVTGEDVRPVPRKDVSPAIDAVFIQRPGLAGAGTISLESASRPGYYLRAFQARMRIEALQSDENFRKDASFVRVKGLASADGVSFQSFASPAYYIGVTGFYETYLTFISNDVDRKLVTFFERQP